MATATEKIIKAGEKAGVTVTVTQHPKGTGEITLLPGLRPPPERDA